MYLRLKNIFIYSTASLILFVAGWACSKYNNPAGITDETVVAVVGDHNITFKDWMRQMDLLRVFATPIDPDNKDQVKAVLDSLIDQQVVLEAAQKDHYSNGAFDEGLKKKLLEADLKLKEIKDKLSKDMQTLQRIEKNYQDPYKKMLLARQYANNKVSDVIVTEKDIRDWYDDYSVQAKQAGQSLPPFSKLTPKIKEEKIKPNVQAEKFIKDLTAATKIDKKTDVIEKYLSSLSISEKLLGSDESSLPLDNAKGSDSKGQNP